MNVGALSMSEAKILAIDPGMKTGVACWPEYETETFTDMLELGTFIVAYYENPTYMVIEDYNIFTSFSNAASKPTLQNMGGCMMLANLLGYMLSIQQPFVRKQIDVIPANWDYSNRDEKSAIQHLEYFKLRS